MLTNFLSRYRNSVIVALRYSLAVIFIWFGVLKMLGYNPVFDLIYHSMAPMLAAGIGLQLLGLFEAFLGLMLFINRGRTLTHMLLVLHLLGTFSTFLFGWNIIFEPKFPILSLSGEFVVKNVVLLLAALGVLLYEKK